MDPEQIYLLHRTLIERSIKVVCSRHRLHGADADDFASETRLHLIADDYAVLRRFEGRSSIATFLVVVIAHRYQDWRNARWGKWRPSAEARRLGPVAIDLERLIVRDRLSFNDAYETLRTSLRLTESRDAIEELAARFPVRHGRSFVSERVLDKHVAVGSDADGELTRQAAAAMARQTAEVLRTARAGLPPQDRLILRMRFESDLQIAEIARALSLEPRPLYRRINRVLQALRKALEAGGVTADTATAVLLSHGFDTVEEGETVEQKSDAGVRPLTIGPAGSTAQTARTP